MMALDLYKFNHFIIHFLKLYFEIILKNKKYKDQLTLFANSKK